MVWQAKTNFSAGDLVEARKGETRIVARLVWSGDCLFFDGWGSGVLSAAYEGFVLSLVEAATPPLPTEPGIYADIDGDPWKLNATTGDYETRWSFGNEYRTRAQVSQNVPFTRLGPVPDIAKKVIDAVRSRVTLHCHVCAMRLTDIGAEFGVSDARG